MTIDREEAHGLAQRLYPWYRINDVTEVELIDRFSDGEDFDVGQWKNLYLKLHDDHMRSIVAAKCRCGDSEDECDLSKLTRYVQDRYLGLRFG